MILTAHQPVYLPWLGLFHKIALADAYCHFDDVQFQNRDFNDRNKIKTPSGPIWLSVPVLHRGYLDKKFAEMEIDNARNWRKKHWFSIQMNYQRTPYFTKYAPFFEDVYKREWRYLAELNEYMLSWYIAELGIKVTYHKASELQLQGSKSDLVLDMCKKLKADVFIFGALGKNYAKVENFTEAGIVPVFQEYKHPTYPQLYGSFLPYMSVVDLMFNCGPQSLDILMSGNLTKEELLRYAK